MADDSPIVHSAGTALPVGGNDGWIRVLGRRRRGRTSQTPSEDRKAGWRELLEGAVEELNEDFRRAGTPFQCALKETDQGLYLHVRRGRDTGRSEEMEEILDPADFPRWLRRIRARLGLLVDEKA